MNFGIDVKKFIDEYFMENDDKLMERMDQIIGDNDDPVEISALADWVFRDYLTEAFAGAVAANNRKVRDNMKNMLLPVYEALGIEFEDMYTEEISSEDKESPVDVEGDSPEFLSDVLTGSKDSYSEEDTDYEDSSETSNYDTAEMPKEKESAVFHSESEGEGILQKQDEQEDLIYYDSEKDPSSTNFKSQQQLRLKPFAPTISDKIKDMVAMSYVKDSTERSYQNHSLLSTREGSLPNLNFNIGHYGNFESTPSNPDMKYPSISDIKPSSLNSTVKSFAPSGGLGSIKSPSPRDSFGENDFTRKKFSFAINEPGEESDDSMSELQNGGA